MRMFIISKNKYLWNNMNILEICFIRLNNNAHEILENYINIPPLPLKYMCCFIHFLSETPWSCGRQLTQVSFLKR